ncbi:MAG TPA: GTPase ObgE [Ignavibacteriales bacterium]|nr:GTPase ObgE [Ignavibacteriales bacterium]
MFIDYAEIEVKAGHGGSGQISFRREKYVPKGGPSGGDGGKGGDVVIRAHHNLHTLLDFRYKRHYSAENGDKGGNSLKDGKNGSNVIIQVPVGTIIKDRESGNVLADLDHDGKSVVIAKGGIGGRGNSKFATPTNQTPRHAEGGRPGEEKSIALELKLIADVGLVGFPNAGKSTLISVISAAKPKIADYPFTTLEPNLGIVQYKDYQSFVVADIPGIIEGAHTGKGLGIKFLRHIERTGILLFLIEVTSENYQKDYDTLVNELAGYSEVLLNKKRIVAFSKADLLEESELKKLKKKKLKRYDGTPLVFSSASGYGLEELKDKLWSELSQ